MEGFDNLRKVLNDFGYEFKQQVRDKIYAENALATGELLNSIEFEVVEDETEGFTLYLLHAPYFHYVNENTKPHWPPKGSLEDWIESKPIIPTADENGRLPTVEQLDFLIRRKISREGTKGHYFFEATLNGLLEKYYPLIVDAIYADVEVDLQGLI